MRGDLEEENGLKESLIFKTEWEDFQLEKIELPVTEKFALFSTYC